MRYVAPLGSSESTSFVLRTFLRELQHDSSPVIQAGADGTMLKEMAKYSGIAEGSLRNCLGGAELEADRTPGSSAIESSKLRHLPVSN